MKFNVYQKNKITQQHSGYFIFGRGKLYRMIIHDEEVNSEYILKAFELSRTKINDSPKPPKRFTIEI